MKKLRNLFLILMAVLVVVPLLTFNWEKDSVSPIDNRKLAEFNLAEGDKTNMIDQFIKDRIGFRSESIDMYTKLNDKLFGEMVHPSYTYGKNGQIFFKMKAETADAEFIDAFCGYLKQVQDYCEARNVPFLYCINPFKTTVYHQYLPSGYTYRNDFLKLLYRALDEQGVHYISNVELLTEKAKTEQVYNVKFDAGHWNDQGCFYGTNHLLEEISKDFPAVSPHKIEDFQISEKEETSLPVSHFQIQEMVPYYENRKEVQVENRKDEFSAVRLDYNYRGFGVFENNNSGADKLPRVLFFHGSYYNSRTRFYDTSFRETYQVHNYQNFIDFDYYFNLFQPDCVILETAEYATTRGYFNIDRLQEKHLNPLYESVKNVPHTEIKLDSLSYTLNTEDAITTISIELDNSYKYGYLIMNGKEYDLQISGTTAQCTLQTEWLDENSTKDIQISLFQPEK